MLHIERISTTQVSVEVEMNKKHFQRNITVV